jgi:hypothetical protein
MSVLASHTRALSAGVLRRAVSSGSRLRAAGLLLERVVTCHHPRRGWLPCAAGAAGAAVLSSRRRPNPSVEGTSNIRLRLLSAAPHLQR